MADLQVNDDILVRTFARIHAVALGISCGILLGLGILAATVILLLKGGDQVGPNLVLLAQYLPGYSVTWWGGVVGAFDGLVVGFILGWLTAFLRNLVITTYLHVMRFWSQLSNRFLDGVDS